MKKYKVKFINVKSTQTRGFGNLNQARQFALTKLGQDVVLTNRKGIVLPL